MSSQYYELYRGSSIGLSLTDTLDDLINEGRIEPQLAMKILSNFDRVITEVLADKVRARLNFKGHLDTYRFCDEVWTFLIKDVNFKLDTQSSVHADKVKISPPSASIRKPPPEEFLKEGFDNDDMYIMVEDEFYAVAQTFTQHLHHAEYLRRIKQAKLENANAIKDIARPTDGKTVMREDKKRQMESESLSAQQMAGLSEITAKRPRVESEGETDTDVDKEDDPWFGTSLHGLMTSSRQTRYLVGLEGVKSSTRAAAGYRQLSMPKSGSGPFQSVQEPQKGPGLTAVDETASEDDDLELAPIGTPIKTSSSPQKLFHKRRASSEVGIKSINTLKEPHETKNGHDSGPEKKKGAPRTSNFRSKMKLLLDELDDFDESPKIKEVKIKEETKDDRSSPLVSAQKSSEEKMLEKQKSRLNEVPTFLV
ncbi:hypothetical protein Egran_00115 [Elaphomyces granulatus]|uniref:Transcription initiation factor IIA subunit 2 n=1 Tax=Elaphomyces granulatus TaxID=519963 RepID=A0A232M6T4_9EURO|nr:hypothetical protein Egran_00115 [Elaphomyces granulatus]